jgi:kynurenine formamidase
MCESCLDKFNTWKGWLDVPPARVGQGVGEWSDLSHVLTEDLSRSPAFPKPQIRRIVSQPSAPANVTEIQTVVHHGTHVDAPRHFIGNGPTFDEIPLDRLYGAGVVWHIDKGPFGVIEVADFEAASPKVQPGDIVLLDTGYARHINTENYETHASVSGAAAQWLVDRKIKMFGVDFSTPDLAAHRRSKDYDFPVHNTLLSNGVLIIEHLNNVAALAGRRIEAMFMSVSVKGADGGLTRAVARPART